jgi:hypothetical protein
MENYFMVTNLQKSKIVFAILLALSFSKVSYSQSLLKANCGNTDAYGQLSAAGYGMELPDCKDGKKHINIVKDATVGCAFAFTLHAKVDNDRCSGTDRQRCEIKMNESSAKLGVTRTYQWKFKLDAKFQANSSFCHIHQLKADGTGDIGSPIMTLTTRKGSPDKLQLIFTAPAGKSGSATLTSVNLAPFKGTWVQVTEVVTYAASGKYSIYIKTLSGTVLLNYTKNGLNFDRKATLYRPKYGIYRSLNSIADIRDETVLFADFCYSKSTATCYTKSAEEVANDLAAAENPVGENKITISPNPVGAQNAKVCFSLSEASNVSIAIFNLAGQQVLSVEKVQLEAGDQCYPIDVAGLANGTYIVKVASDKFAAKGKLVINK